MLFSPVPWAGARRQRVSAHGSQADPSHRQLRKLGQEAPGPAGQTMWLAHGFSIPMPLRTDDKVLLASPAHPDPSPGRSEGLQAGSGQGADGEGRCTRMEQFSAMRFPEWGQGPHAH